MKNSASLFDLRVDLSSIKMLKKESGFVVHALTKKPMPVNSLNSLLLLLDSINYTMKNTFLASVLAGIATAGQLKYGQQADVSNVNVPTYPAADLYSLTASTGNARKTNKNIFGIINEAEASADLTPTRSIDSLFLRLPSSHELDELILSADSVAILKTIQTVATDDSIPCDKRIAYLLELLGRIRCAIEKKTFAA